MLGITMLLLAATSLLALYGWRTLFLEQRSAANLAQATQAFEAAEAGLDWALAQLNANRRTGPDCQASEETSATSFRTRFLQLTPATGIYTPTGEHAVCTHQTSGWSCRCPPDDTSASPTETEATFAPSFRVMFLPGERPGVVRVQAIGCAQAAGPCVPSSPGEADAVARHATAFALLSGLPAPPRATVTTRGRFDAGSGALTLQNPDPAAGIVLHTGGSVDAPHAQVTGPPDAAPQSLVLAQDTTLAGTTPEQFFASHFGAAPDAWGGLPTVRHLTCEADCGTSLEAMIAGTADIALIRIDGDLALQGPMVLGSPARPVAISVRGTARLTGAVALHGLRHAGSLRWDEGGPGALVRGALLVDGDYTGNGAPTMVRDTAVLEALRLGSGGFVRVNGTWQDF